MRVARDAAMEHVNKILSTATQIKKKKENNVFVRRSSHNLHDPMRTGSLPPTGLVSRQQSSPNLNPNVTHTNAPLNTQNAEVERFYQNLSIYRNQESTVKQQISPQQSDDRYRKKK